MRLDVITLFPEIFRSVTDYGISSRAKDRGLWTIHFWNPRATTVDLHRTVDDRPFGGGPGMVMMAEPLAASLEAIRTSGNSGAVVAFSPTGKRIENSLVKDLAKEDKDYVFVCARYEGIDERFIGEFVDLTLSLGDFILSGAEIAACALIDAMVRQLPGAIKADSVADESFNDVLLEAPHYTRPEVWRDKAVPEVLLTGHHANIAKWTREKKLQTTFQNRPDLIKIARSRQLLSREDEAFLNALDLPQK